MRDFLPTLTIFIFVVFTAALAGRELPTPPKGLPLFLVIGLLGAVAGPSMALAAHLPMFLAIPYGAVFLMVLVLSHAVLGEQRRAKAEEAPRSLRRPIPPREPVKIVTLDADRVSQLDPQARPTVVASSRD